MYESPIRFDRRRRMRCGTCHHEWHVTAEWLERFEQSDEGCPACGTDCGNEKRPDFCAEPGSRWRDDTVVRESYWYHSSSHDRWPDKDFDPAADLTVTTKRRFQAMGLNVDEWAARQKSKALHVGTYEAAIENLLRRLRDQRGAFEQFHLYRVRLSPDCVIEPDVHPEPTDWLGNAHLADVVTPGSSVLRYVNVHEDPSSVSLALESAAIHAVQSIQIPLPVNPADPWVLGATARLLRASSEPRRQPTAARQPRRSQPMSALKLEARLLESEIAQELPARLRHRLSIGFDEADFDAATPAAFPARLMGFARLITDPERTLKDLSLEPWRHVN